MAKKTWTLENFGKGQYMSWFVSTQSAVKFNVRLYDEEGNVYFKGTRQSTSIEPPLAQSAAHIKAEPVYLEIEAVGKPELFVWFNNSLITSATTGKRVGNSFILAAEDTKGGDEDYNDIYAALTVWNKEG